MVQQTFVPGTITLKRIDLPGWILKRQNECFTHGSTNMDQFTRFEFKEAKISKNLMGAWVQVELPPVLLASGARDRLQSGGLYFSMSQKDLGFEPHKKRHQFEIYIYSQFFGVLCWNPFG